MNQNEGHMAADQTPINEAFPSWLRVGQEYVYMHTKRLKSELDSHSVTRCN